MFAKPIGAKRPSRELFHDYAHSSAGQKGCNKTQSSSSQSGPLTWSCADLKHSLTRSCTDLKHSLKRSCTDLTRSLPLSCTDLKRSLTWRCTDRKRSLTWNCTEQSFFVFCFVFNVGLSLQITRQLHTRQCQYPHAQRSRLSAADGDYSPPGNCRPARDERDLRSFP